MKEINLKLKGEARVRLIDERLIAEARRKHPDWDPARLRQLVIDKVEFDSGWCNNTVTDLTRITIAQGTAFGSSLNIFIHGGTNPASTFTNSLQYLYSAQSPNQVRTPDTTVLDQSTLVQTRTVQFPAPTIARNINIAGLTFASSADSTGNIVTGIAAFTRLSSTISQSTVQVADVQYRVTFSVET